MSNIRWVVFLLQDHQRSLDGATYQLQGRCNCATYDSALEMLEDLRSAMPGCCFGLLPEDIWNHLCGANKASWPPEGSSRPW